MKYQYMYMTDPTPLSTADVTRHTASEHDDTLHTMTARDLEARVIAAGIKLSYRQLLRHCEGDTFDAKKMPGANNRLEWFIAPASVDRGIADIKTLQSRSARRDTAGHDASRPDTPRHDDTHPVVSDHDAPPHDTTRHDAVGPDTSGHDATQPDTTRHDAPRRNPADSDYVRLLETTNVFLRDQITTKDRQLASKDDQIANLSQHFNQSQGLFGAMQRMLAPLLGQKDPFKPGPTPDVQSEIGEKA